MPIASTPLKPIHDQFSRRDHYVDARSALNIDDFSGAEFALWASTPAVIWTASRPQQRGIHVHLWMNGSQMVDDVFGTVVYRGKYLERSQLLKAMVQNTIV